MESNVIRFFWCYCGEGIRVDARYAGKRGPCPKCGAVVLAPNDKTLVSESGIHSDTQQPQSLDRELAATQRCDSCGMAVSSIATACPACGNELYRKSASSYIDDLRRQMANVSLSKKPEIVQMFTAPNNKDVILELLSLATSNGDADNSVNVDQDDLRAAWRAKAKQMLGKAQVFAERDSEYRRILAPFEATINAWAGERREQWIVVGIIWAALFFLIIVALLILK